MSDVITWLRIYFGIPIEELFILFKPVDISLLSDMGIRVITAVIASCVVLTCMVDAAKDTYRLGVLIPIEGYLDLSAYIPTMELALETVENDTSLPFSFTYTLNDSMVS